MGSQTDAQRGPLANLGSIKNNFLPPNAFRLATDATPWLTDDLPIRCLTIILKSAGEVGEFVINRTASGHGNTNGNGNFAGNDTNAEYTLWLNVPGMTPAYKFAVAKHNEQLWPGIIRQLDRDNRELSLTWVDCHSVKTRRFAADGVFSQCPRLRFHVAAIRIIHNNGGYRLDSMHSPPPCATLAELVHVLQTQGFARPMWECDGELVRLHLKTDCRCWRPAGAKIPDTHKLREADLQLPLHSTRSQAEHIFSGHWCQPGDFVCRFADQTEEEERGAAVTISSMSAIRVLHKRIGVNDTGLFYFEDCPDIGFFLLSDLLDYIVVHEKIDGIPLRRLVNIGNTTPLLGEDTSLRRIPKYSRPDGVSSLWRGLRRTRTVSSFPPSRHLHHHQQQPRQQQHIHLNHHHHHHHHQQQQQQHESTRAVLRAASQAMASWSSDETINRLPFHPRTQASWQQQQNMQQHPSGAGVGRGAAGASGSDEGDGDEEVASGMGHGGAGGDQAGGFESDTTDDLNNHLSRPAHTPNAWTVLTSPSGTASVATGASMAIPPSISWMTMDEHSCDESPGGGAARQHRRPSMTMAESDASDGDASASSNLPLPTSLSRVNMSAQARSAAAATVSQRQQLMQQRLREPDMLHHRRCASASDSNDMDTESSAGTTTTTLSEWSSDNGQSASPSKLRQTLPQSPPPPSVTGPIATAAAGTATKATAAKPTQASARSAPTSPGARMRTSRDFGASGEQVGQRPQSLLAQRAGTISPHAVSASAGNGGGGGAVREGAEEGTTARVRQQELADEEARTDAELQREDEREEADEDDAGLGMSHAADEAAECESATSPTVAEVTPKPISGCAAREQPPLSAQQQQQQQPSRFGHGGRRGSAMSPDLQYEQQRLQAALESGGQKRAVSSSQLGVDLTTKRPVISPTRQQMQQQQQEQRPHETEYQQLRHLQAHPAEGRRGQQQQRQVAQAFLGADSACRSLSATDRLPASLGTPTSPLGATSVSVSPPRRHLRAHHGQQQPQQPQQQRFAFPAAVPRGVPGGGSGDQPAAVADTMFSETIPEQKSMGHPGLGLRPFVQLGQSHIMASRPTPRNASRFTKGISSRPPQRTHLPPPPPWRLQQQQQQQQQRQQQGSGKNDEGSDRRGRQSLASSSSSSHSFLNAMAASNLQDEIDDIFG